MKKIVLIPDSFKGTLSSKEICEIIKSRINAHYNGVEVVSIPVADGGEGSVDSFLTALGGEKIIAECKNPYFEDMQGFYGLINGGQTAVIEMAACAGLPLVENRKNPLKTTTFGVGELIKTAAKSGVKQIILGLGGSCTNDFGCGAAAALGVNFFDKNGNQFVPTGGTLKDVCSIDLSKKDKLLDDIKITAMCDIDNPPFGENGAARIFAPQKGADEKTVQILDEGVKHICSLIKRDLKIDLSALAGGGAAGAFGAGAVAFLGAQLKMGIDVVLDTVGFDEVIKDADAVFTGEGKIDGQSLRGKVVIGVAKRSKKQGVPVFAVVGGADGDMSEAYEQGVSAVFTINRLPEDFSISRYKSRDNLEFAIDNILRAFKVIDNRKQ